MEYFGICRDMHSNHTVWRYLIARKYVGNSQSNQMRPVLFVEQAWGNEETHFRLMRKKYSVAEKQMLAEGILVSDCGRVQLVVSRGGIPKSALEDIIDILTIEVDEQNITIGETGTASRKWVAAGYLID